MRRSEKGGTRDDVPLRRAGGSYQEGFFWGAVPNATLLTSRSQSS